MAHKADILNDAQTRANRHIFKSHVCVFEQVQFLFSSAARRSLAANVVYIVCKIKCARREIEERGVQK